MLFGVKLSNDIYPPWKDSYMDYERLKKLLKEALITDKSASTTAKGEDPLWSDNDESRFVEALDKELEKVYGFLVSKYDSLMSKLNRLEEQTTSEDKIRELDFDSFQKNVGGCAERSTTARWLLQAKLYWIFQNRKET